MKKASPPLTFDLPSWLPPSVASTIQEIQVTNDRLSVDEQLLRCLASDPRMESVWGELCKKKRSSSRSTNDFFHPARVSSTSDDPQFNQDQAVRSFFWSAYFIARHGVRVRTRSEISSVGIDVGDAIFRLRELSEQLSLRLFFVEANELDQLADKWEKQLLNYYYEDEEEIYGDLLVDRHRFDPRLRGYVRELAKVTAFWFGSCLCGTLATVANVAYPNPSPHKCLTGKQVRELVRHMGLRG